MGRARGRALVLVMAMLTGCTPAVDLSSRVVPEPAVTLWVLDHGWHTAIVVRRAEVDLVRWPELDDLPPSTLVEFAWGDREFYMARPASTWLAIKAALGSGPSVLHVVGLEEPIAASFPYSRLVALRVSRPGFEALTRLVSEEYERDDAGRPLRLGRGLYGASWFYAARGRYSLSNTCNTWVARALRTAGLPVNPSGVITAGGVMDQIAPR